MNRFVNTYLKSNRMEFLAFFTMCLNYIIITVNLMKLCLTLGPAYPGADTDKYLETTDATSNFIIAKSCSLSRYELASKMKSFSFILLFNLLKAWVREYLPSEYCHYFRIHLRNMGLIRDLPERCAHCWFYRGP